MRNPRWFCWPLAATLVAACLGGSLLCPARAAEDPQRFLEGLIERQYYDVVLMYLDQVRDSPTIDKEFKQSIDYQAGIALIDAARTERDTAIREKYLADARDRFNKFLADFPNHGDAGLAKNKLAQLLVERGKIKVDQADSTSRTAEQKKQLLEEARTLYTDAQKVFEQLEQGFLEEHQKFPKVIEQSNTELLEQRDNVRKSLLQSRLDLATVIYERAKTYPEGSAEFKSTLEDSAKRYAELYEKYGSKLAGLYARMWEARCYKELGDSDRVFKTLDDVFALPGNEEAFRVLKNKAAVLALETAVTPKVKKYEQALTLHEIWDKDARPHEENSPEGLAIKFLTARAALELNQQEKRNEYHALAKRNLEYVVRYPSQYQSEARALLLELTGGEDSPPKDFADASGRAKVALGRAADEQLSEEERAQARAEAIKYCRAALKLRTADIDNDKINVIRYYLAYLYWLDGRVWDAAVCGEFLARRYPSGTGAKQGAKIAMAAFAKLLFEAGEDNQFERDHMVEIAKFITERWAGTADADEAWMMLIRIAVISQEPKTAYEYLQNIPEDSPRRGEAELMTGQALWAVYLQAARLPEGERPAQDKLDALKTQAQDTLRAGIERMRTAVQGGAPITTTLTAAVLSLAQMAVSSGKAEEAVKWLDDPQVGAMTLVMAKDPATQTGNYAIEAHKAALRAYVAAQELDKAKATMQRLETLVSESGDAEAGKRLTAIYISLGRQLAGTLTRLREEGNNQEASQVEDSFRQFLEQIKSSDGVKFSELNWVAETFKGLATSHDTGTTLAPDAKEAYEKAADTYQTILKRISEPDFGAPAGAEDSIKLRLARVLRSLGQYEESADLLAAILETRNSMLDVQVEAAYTYQAWGEERATYYEQAIQGAREYTREDGTKAKLVWGWGALAKKVMRSPKHKSIFHEARYNLALCRMREGLAEKNATQRKETLEKAERDILMLSRLFPDMGREEGWYEKYDELLKQIQGLLKKKQTGLAGS